MNIFKRMWNKWKFRKLKKPISLVFPEHVTSLTIQMKAGSTGGAGENILHPDSPVKVTFHE